MALLHGSSAPGPLRSQPTTAGTVPCALQAFVIDQDPQRVNVRSGPGVAAAVIGNLPTTTVDGVIVTITGARGEWLRITRAVEVSGAPVFFTGEGWVHAPLLGKGVSHPAPLYQEPSEKSRVVRSVPAEEGDVQLRGCRGAWAYVEYKGVRGWAAPGALCYTPVTTCP
jgi:SH3-like domain-containing protein